MTGNTADIFRAVAETWLDEHKGFLRGLGVVMAGVVLVIILFSYLDILRINKI